MTALAPVRSTPRVPAAVAGRVLRLVLAVLLVGIGVSSYVSTPVQRPLTDLLGGLEAGRVHSMRVEVPPVGTTGSGFDVRWSTGSPRHYDSQYELTDGTAAPPNVVLAAVARSPRHVDVTTAASPPTPPSGLRPDGVVGLLVVLALFGLLVWGRDPRLVTRWGWFWLACSLPVSAVAFVLSEPSPLWRADARRGRRRLTGGWAFLLGAAGAAVGARVFPSLSGLLWRST